MNEEMIKGMHIDDMVFDVTIPKMITDLKAKTCAIKEKVQTLSEKIDTAPLTTDLMGGFKEAKDAYNAAMMEFNPGYLSSMNELSGMMTQLFFNIFMGFEEEKYPIDERLEQVQSYLPTTNLHQYRYLDIAHFTKGVKDGVTANRMNEADPENCCYIDPVDMYVKTILTRTIIYLRRLQEADLIEAPRSAIGVAGLYAEVLGTNVQEDLNGIEGMLDKMIDMLPETVNDPNKINNIKTASVIITDRIRDTIIPLLTATESCLCFYEKLLKVLKESRDTIGKAYEMYKEIFNVTF